MIYAIFWYSNFQMKVKKMVIKSTSSILAPSSVDTPWHSHILPYSICVLVSYHRHGSASTDLCLASGQAKGQMFSGKPAMDHPPCAHHWVTRWFNHGQSLSKHHWIWLAIHTTSLNQHQPVSKHHEPLSNRNQPRSHISHSQTITTYAQPLNNHWPYYIISRVFNQVSIVSQSFTLVNPSCTWVNPSFTLVNPPFTSR